MAFQSNSSNLRNESINSFWFSLSIRENPWVSSIRLDQVSLRWNGSWYTSREAILPFQTRWNTIASPSIYFLPNSNSVFGYNNRMLLIQGAYKRQKTGHTGGGFGNWTAGHIRFICRIMRIRFLLGCIIPKRITDGMCQCTLAPFRFVYDTGFRCYRQIIDSSKT